MTENSLSPAFVRINYSSAYGLHTMTVPSVPYIPPSVGNITGSFDLRGAALDTPAGPAVIAYVNVLKPFVHPSVNFIDYTIFSQVDESTPAVPQYSAPLAIAGTASGGAWSKAVQMTWSFRTTGFGLFKIVLLDANSNNSFDRVTSLAGGSAGAALRDYVIADTSWISGRDGERPNVFLQYALTLNEKLRKSYRMN